MPLSLNERHAIRLAQDEATALQLDRGDQFAGDWATYTRVHNQHFGTNHTAAKIQYDGVNCFRKKQSNDIAFEVQLKYGNFTQDGINRRNALRTDLLAAAAQLGINLGAGAMMGNDGPARPVGPPLSQTTLAAHIAAQQGASNVALPALPNVAAPVQTVVPATVPATAPTTTVGDQSYLICTGLEYPEDAVFALDLRSTLAAYSDEHKLVLLSEAFPTWKPDSFSDRLGNQGGDVTLTWQAIIRHKSVAKTRNLEDSLKVHIMVRKDVDGVVQRIEEPAFPFLQCLTHYRSPLSPRPFPSNNANKLAIVREVDTRAATAMLRFRQRPTIDGVLLREAVKAKLDTMPMGRRVEVLQQVFAEYDAAHPGSIAALLQSRSGKSRLVWLHLEEKRRTLGVDEEVPWRPLFKYSEIFSSPLSVLYEDTE